jgi:hypothetical protein
MEIHGYSGTPLVKKLGIKERFSVLFLNAPDHYFESLTGIPGDITLADAASNGLDFIQYFTSSMQRLKEDLPLLKEQIAQNGMIWISWPKKSSKMVSDVSEDQIRDLALACGLVDVKVCAVDGIWSALKLVIRLKDRKPSK